MEIIVWVLLCVAGIAVGYVIGSNRCKSRFEAETKESASVIRRLETEITVADERLKSEQTKFERILADREETEKRTSILQERHHREAMDALQNRFDETVAKRQEQLKTATAELLKARQQEFEQTSRDSMAHILEPLNRQLGQMREAVTENTRVHGELGGRMSADISNLLRCSESARESADRLANALRNGGRYRETGVRPYSPSSSNPRDSARAFTSTLSHSSETHPEILSGKMAWRPCAPTSYFIWTRNGTW